MSTAKPARAKKRKAATPAPDEAVPEKAVLNTKGLFTRDLATMMYGFGDDPTPYQESVDLVEEMMVDYVVETMCKAVAAGAAKGGKATTEDVIFTVRKLAYQGPSAAIKAAIKAGGTPGAVPEYRFVAKLSILTKQHTLDAAQDPRKFARVKELLQMQKEIQLAKKSFKEDEIIPDE